MFVSVKRPTEDAWPSPYRGPDRRSRTLGLAGRLPAGQVLPMTLLVGVGAGIPALFLIPRQPDAATVTSYFLVAAGLLSVVAGGTGPCRGGSSATRSRGGLGVPSSASGS